MLRLQEVRVNRDSVHSPTLSGTTQLDSYRPLLLPTILIGDARLGGISTTISSYESLLLRGYTVDAVLLFYDAYYRNWEYLKAYFDKRGIHVSSIASPPSRMTNFEEDLVSTEQYYQTIVPQNGQGDIYEVIDHLDGCHTRRIQELDSLPRRTLSTVWWPFVQHGLITSEKDVTVIDSASSDFFSVYNSHRDGIMHLKTPQESLLEPQFDGSASWWTQALGHAHPELTLAAASAAGRYGHVMFPQATHLPALQLAERLVHNGPGRGWASRAFFSDDGSTAMEIAIKMALRAYSVRYGESLDASAKKNLGIMGLKGSYHGDTIGSMDACEEGIYTCEWHSAKGYWFEPPTIFIRRGKVVIALPPALAGMDSAVSDIDAESLSWVYDVSARLDTPLADLYRDYIGRTLRNLKENCSPRLAAVILEPLLMGAGGMIFVDPLFQRILVDVVRGPSDSTNSWSGLPVIFDEVFVGLYRIGIESAGPLLGVFPDISVNAKILTGGLVPMAVTLASDSIFQAFMSDKKADALLHGHSYTAHPIGCAVANKALDIIEELVETQPISEAQAKWAKVSCDRRKNIVWSLWDPDFVRTLSCLPKVDKVMTLGTVLAINFEDEEEGYCSHSAQALLQSLKASVHNDLLMSSGPGGTPFGINYRTLGNVAYFMTSLNTSPTTIRSVEDRIWSALRGSTTS